MYKESDLLPLSGLQHLLYCERQWALIHIEQQWEENRFTASGRLLHKVVDGSADESHSGLRIVRSLPLQSLRIGIAGKADVIEFPRHGGSPRPVEYKRGKPKLGDWDNVQLCAQGMCLEEMLNTEVPEGALYYGTPRRRTRVAFSQQLRSRTEAAAKRMHELFDSRISPAPVYLPAKCDKCSLIEICLPKELGRKDCGRAFLAVSIRRTLASGGEG